MRLFLSIIAVVLSLSALGQYNPMADHPLLAQIQSRVTGIPLTNQGNLWYDFEQDGVAATDFNAHDHGDGSVTVVDGASQLSISTAGEQLNWPGGIVESGTRGLAVALNNTTSAYFRSDFTGQSNVSCGFWLYTPAFPTNAFLGIGGMVDANNNPAVHWSYQNVGGVYRIWFATANDATNLVISPSTWYWITGKNVISNTCYCRVYDITGSQVGISMTLPQYWSNNIAGIRIGHDSSACISALNLYYDDVMIDYSAAVFPLGPNF